VPHTLKNLLRAKANSYNKQHTLNSTHPHTKYTVVYVQATNSFISDIKPKRLDKPKAVAEEIVKGGKKKAKNFETSIWFVSIF
jgi:hypothetical protein